MQCASVNRDSKLIAKACGELATDSKSVRLHKERFLWAHLIVWYNYSWLIAALKSCQQRSRKKEMDSILAGFCAPIINTQQDNFGSKSFTERT